MFLVFCYFTLFSCLFINVSAQTYKSDTVANPAKTLQLTSSFNLTLITGLTQKAIIHREEGFYNVKSSMQPYFEGGAD
ncbi:MAG: hypothetical protein M3R72_00605, partial [Bacteroidota bacterium]|nr:hypothetical protein [Bacteroidota bacterium]